MRPLAVGCLGLVFCGLAWPQATSQISGTVRDQSGLAIPGAEVKVTQTATGAVRTVNAATDGGYVLASLPIGPYLLEVTKEGFSKYVQSGIVLQVDSNPTIDIAMKVGAVNEQVTVEANAAQVETRSTGVGQVVDNRRVSEMPLNGRQPIELVFLAGMASAPGAGAINTVRNYPTVVVSVAGGQGNGVGYQLDGTIYQDPYNNLALPIPFPDALQEFKVETSALPAQYGYHSTATVNAVTKSGSNEFHGDLFEFLRNTDLTARDFFNPTRTQLNRNQFGGVVGGRIITDKLFFFAGYQRTALRSVSPPSYEYVPTARMLAGDFSVFASAACGNPKNLPASLGFTSNQISPAMLNPVALAFVKTLPAPNDACGTTLVNYISNLDEDLPVGRIDFIKSSRQTIFGRFALGNLNTPSTYDGKSPLTINTYGVHDLDYQLAIGDTYLFTSNLVNSLRISASRTNIVKLPDTYASWQTFGANYAPIGGNVVNTTISGGLGFNVGTSAAVPGASHNGPNPSVTDELSWIKGSHQFLFGGNLYWQEMNYWSGLNAVGSMTFNGSSGTGLGMTDMLLGLASGFSQGTAYGFYNRQWYTSMYAQDTWKASRKLTVNYGVRWEPYLGQYNKWGQIHDVVPGLFAAGYHSPVYTNAPAGVIFPGDPNYPCGKSFQCDDWHKFLPRVGLAWDPKGDGKMVIRAGYGIYQDRSHMFYPNQMSFGPPFGDNVSAFVTNLSNLWGPYGGVPGFSPQGQNPIPALSAVAGIGSAGKNAPFPTGGGYIDFANQGFKPMYSNQWNLAIEKQIDTWLFKVNYIGNSVVHMVSSTYKNPALFLGLGPCTLQVVNAAGQVVNQNYSTCSTTANQNFRRSLYMQNPLQGQYYGGISQVLDSGTQEYGGLNLVVQKALSHGVVFNANYTWSHCIGDIYDQQPPQGGGVTPPYNRRAYRGNCTGIDQRQQFVLNLVATSPRLPNAWARRLLSDWQIAPILQIHSGQWLTVTSGTDRALTTVANQTVNQVLANPYASNKGAANGNATINWLNPAAFAIPALGTYGTTADGIVVGPGLIQLNMALSRTFKIRERASFQLRGEAFNLPNHLNPGNPATAGTSYAPLNSALYGLINSDQSGNIGGGLQVNAGDYRIVQLAAKIVF
jgi:hypothetical protein